MMKLSEETQSVIGNALVQRREYCRAQMEKARQVLQGSEAEEDAAFWRGQYTLAETALREWWARNQG